MTEPAPIACTLEAADFKSRIAWIADLNRRALISGTRNGLELELLYRTEHRADVLKMVEGEQRCCAFLSFQVKESAEAVRVLVSAPEEGRDAAGTIFEQFLSKGSAGDRYASSVAVTVSAAALACGACCLAPVLLPAAVLAMSGAALSWLERGEAFATVLASAVVALAWLWSSLSWRRSRRRPSFRAVSPLLLATGLTIAAWVWPYIEFY